MNYHNKIQLIDEKICIFNDVTFRMFTIQTSGGKLRAVLDREGLSNTGSTEIQIYGDPDFEDHRCKFQHLQDFKENIIFKDELENSSRVMKTIITKRKF